MQMIRTSYQFDSHNIHLSKLVHIFHFIDIDQQYNLCIRHIQCKMCRHLGTVYIYDLSSHCNMDLGKQIRIFLLVDKHNKVMHIIRHIHCYNQLRKFELQKLLGLHLGRQVRMRLIFYQHNCLVGNSLHIIQMSYQHREAGLKDN